VEIRTGGGGIRQLELGPVDAFNYEFMGSKLSPKLNKLSTFNRNTIQYSFSAKSQTTSPCQ